MPQTITTTPYLDPVRPVDRTQDGLSRWAGLAPQAIAATFPS